MPNVFVEGPCLIDDYYATFQPLSRTEAGLTLKLSDCFINARHSEAVVDVTVVENRRAQSFFALILQRENGALVKLLPRTDPEKTDGVRKVVALIAGQLKAQSPACRYGQNNIEGYLG